MGAASRQLKLSTFLLCYLYNVMTNSECFKLFQHYKATNATNLLSVNVLVAEDEENISTIT